MKGSSIVIIKTLIINVIHLHFNEFHENEINKRGKEI